MSTVGQADPAVLDAMPSARRLYRHRSDVARLVFNLVLLAVLALVGSVASEGVRTLSADVLRVVDALPRPIVEGTLGVIQLLGIVVPVAIVVVLVIRRQFALLGILALAAAISSALMALLNGAFEDSVPVAALGYERFESWLIGGQFPSSTYLCGATAVLVAGGPWLPRRWHRASWVLIVAAVLARMLTAVEIPLRSGMLVTLGAAAGSLALLVFGAPRRRVDVATVTAALARAGLPAAALRPRSDTGDVPTFVADGGEASTFVKVLGRDQRDSDLLIQTWRRLTLRGLGDDAPVGSPRRVVDHEALALGLFRSAGVHVATPIATVATPDDAAVLVTSLVEGPSLAELSGDDVSDDDLDALWAQIAVLQARRMAHRRLDTSNVVVTDDGPVLVDLRWADLDADDSALGADVAVLLASLAVVVGVERSTASALRILAVDDLVRAVPLIQAPVLPPRTRKALTSDDLDDLRTRVAAAAGVDEVQLAPVQRITIQGAVSLVGSLVLGYYVISLAADWRDIWAAFGEADLWYVLPILVLTAGTYVTGAMSLIGSVTARLGMARTTAVMFGQGFLNRFTPANAGGMAMRMRYLQLNGVDTPVAAAAVGLTSAVSGVAQAVLLVVFLIWGGSTDRFSDFSFPSVGSILVIILVVGLVVTAVLYTTWGRERIRPWARGAIDKIGTTMREIARDPGKMALLFGGAFLGKLCNIVSFWLSVQAFSVDMSFAKAGALYMIANTIGSAVPSPGGVGGIEAALTGVLISFGVDSGTAAAIVLFFRILTFWLPTLPGYVFLQYTQRKGIV